MLVLRADGGRSHSKKLSVPRSSMDSKFDPSPSQPSTSTTRKRRVISRKNGLATTVAVLMLLAIFGILPLHPLQIQGSRVSLVRGWSRVLGGEPGFHAAAPEPASQTTRSRIAYATFLAGEDEEDKYFVATRILAYQLLHAPETKSINGAPFVVLVDKDVSEGKRERLRRDGAIVWEPEPVASSWLPVASSYYSFSEASTLLKLRLWELTEFERVCFLDAATILTRPLDDVFTDDAIQSKLSLGNMVATREDEARQPRRYVLASVPETAPARSRPPRTGDGSGYLDMDWLDAGFFVLQPGREQLAYYLSLLAKPGQIGQQQTAPEQNLLNYAHRRGGNMPWKQLESRWSVHFPSLEDVEGGVHSLRAKWWEPERHRGLAPYIARWKGRMEGFHEGMSA